MKQNTDENSIDSATSFARDELKKKYSSEFEIEDLTKRENGPFKTREYIGYAYLSNIPNKKFTIWVDMDSKTVTDSYECIAINHWANTWMSTCANSVWDGSELEVWSLLVSKPSGSLSSYTEDSIQSYFSDEFSSNMIYLSVPNLCENEAEKINQFLSDISCVGNGLIYIKFLDEAEKGSLVISLASNRSDIEKQVENWRGDN